MRALLTACLLLVSFQVMAVNSVTTDVTDQVQKNWNVMLDVNHQPAMRKDQFTFTDFTAFLDYRFSSVHSIRLLQAPTAKYDVGAGENEWVASETILHHYWNLPWTTASGVRFRWVNTAMFPTSIEAQDNDKILGLQTSLHANAMFLNNKLMVSLRPFFRYNWYEFKTSRGGFLLPAVVYGVNLITAYSITDKLSLSVSAGYNEVQEIASQFDDSTNGIFEENAEGRYFFQGSLNYSFSDQFGVYVGYAAGDAYIKDGRYEVYAYDPRTTRLSLGSSFYF